MPWMVAIMIFLTMLSAAMGIGLGKAASALGAQLEGRLTVQIVEPNPDLRDRQVRTVLAELARVPIVARAARVDEGQMRALLAPWLGTDGIDADLPVPALIDVDLRAGDPRAAAEVGRTVRALAPRARVDAHADWLGPLQRLLSSLRWLAMALVLLMAGALIAAVMLSARAALVTHRATIDVMHLMGATDGQVSRLFERRAALDTLFGGALGFVCGALVIMGVSGRLDTIGAALLDQGGLGVLGWFTLMLLPLGAAALAVATARWTVKNALAKML
jgi:cell division transport system permease protein